MTFRASLYSSKSVETRTTTVTAAFTVTCVDMRIGHTKRRAPVLPQDAVGAGHDGSFVGHHTDDLHHAAQLLCKLQDTNQSRLLPQPQLSNY